MVTLETIRNDLIFIEFCENRNIALPTIQKYELALSKYTNLTGKSLEQLLDEADEEEEEGIRLRKRKIKKYLLEYKKYLDETDLSESYKRNLILCVRTFYNENEIEIPKTFRKNARSDKKNQSFLFDELPTMEDIKHILKYSDVRFKPIILLGISSGMSRAEICSLTFKDFFDAVPLYPYPETLQELINRLDKINNLIPIWKVSRIKTGNYFFTFNSPEASDSIIDYLKDLNRRVIRSKEDEKLNSEFEFKSEAKIFRNIYLNPMSVKNMSRIYRDLNNKAGFERIDKKLFIRPHSLRKVFASTLEKNKMPHLMTRWLMGHKLDSTTSAYFKADPETVKEEYLQIVNHLTVNQEVEVKIVTTEGYDQLLKDSKAKDEEIKNLKAEKDEEMAKMDKRLKLMEKLYSDKEFAKDRIEK